jgi:hypothetical protein
MNGAKNKIVCEGEEITGTKVTDPKKRSWDLAPGRYICFSEISYG